VCVSLLFLIKNELAACMCSPLQTKKTQGFRKMTAAASQQTLCTSKTNNDLHQDGVI